MAPGLEPRPASAGAARATRTMTMAIFTLRMTQMPPLFSRK
jgi:hypothetical protein